MLASSPLALFALPQWLEDEALNRVVLVLNHLLEQNPKAMQQLKHQAGKTAELSWAMRLLALGDRSVALTLRADTEGLVERVVSPLDAKPHLRLIVTEADPLTAAKQWLQGTKPSVRIEGDVHLASVLQWLMHNVKWDVEHDLAQVFGDVGAYRLHRAGQAVSKQLKHWLDKARASASAQAQATAL